MKNTLILLQEFGEIEKFSNEKWAERGLIPSEERIVKIMDQFINEFANHLIKMIQEGGKDEELKKAALLFTERLSFSIFDTEENEFIIDYISQLFNICQIEIKAEEALNSLVGQEFLSMLDFESLEEVHETNFVNSYKVENKCEQCDSILVCSVIETSDGFSRIGIAKCWNCLNYSLFYLPQGMKFFSSQNFYLETISIDTKKTKKLFKERILKLNKQNQ